MISLISNRVHLNIDCHCVLHFHDPFTQWGKYDVANPKCS